MKHLERSRVLVYVVDLAGTDNREPWTDYKTLRKEIEEYSAELAERPSITVCNKIDAVEELESLKARFEAETGVKPIYISCDQRQGLEEFKTRLREIVQPKTRFHHTHAEHGLDLKDMPDTTGEEVPAEAFKYATFLKLEKPKAKSHPSRGNIH